MKTPKLKTEKLGPKMLNELSRAPFKNNKQLERNRWKVSKKDVEGTVKTSSKKVQQLRLLRENRSKMLKNGGAITKELPVRPVKHRTVKDAQLKNTQHQNLVLCFPLWGQAEANFWLGLQVSAGNEKSNVGVGSKPPKNQSKKQSLVKEKDEEDAQEQVDKKVDKKVDKSKPNKRKQLKGDTLMFDWL